MPQFHPESSTESADKDQLKDFEKEREEKLINDEVKAFKSGFYDKYKITDARIVRIEINNDKHDDFYDEDGNLLFTISTNPKETGKYKPKNPAASALALLGLLQK